MSDRTRSAIAEPAWVRRSLIGLALAFLTLFLLVPLFAIFHLALGRGLGAYLSALRQPDAVAAIRLTLLVALLVVPLNTAFGVSAAWLLAKYRFRGRDVLLTLIDVPFGVSPVIAGLMFVLLFGRQGWLGPWLMDHDVRIVFAVPGIVIATLFVTCPFVVREVLPALQTRGHDDEEAALTLGANGLQMFRRVTLPKIKWSLLCGIVLCNARAMGEFGAVSVVSGHVRGLTNTIPLHAEILYNQYDAVGAFAVASLLTLVALVTLFAKKLLEWKAGGA